MGPWSFCPQREGLFIFRQRGCLISFSSEVVEGVDLISFGGEEALILFLPCGLDFFLRGCGVLDLFFLKARIRDFFPLRWGHWCLFPQSGPWFLFHQRVGALSLVIQTVGVPQSLVAERNIFFLHIGDLDFFPSEGGLDFLCLRGIHWFIFPQRMRTYISFPQGGLTSFSSQSGVFFL